MRFRAFTRTIPRAGLFFYSALCLLVSGSLAQPADPAPDALMPGAVFRGGPARAGVYAGPVSQTVPARLWERDTPRPNRTTPALADGLVFYGNEDGTYYAADALTGAPVWERRFSGSVVSTAAVADGVLVVGSLNGTVYALDAATGDEIWAFETGDDVYSSPLIVDDRVFIGSLDGGLYALALADGAEQWRLAFAGQVWGSPAAAVLDSGRTLVIAASRGGDVQAADAATGEPVWRFEAGGFDATPAVSGGVAYLGSYDGQVYALDVATGAEVWRFQTGSAVYASAAVAEPAVAAGSVFAVSYDGAVFALDVETGAQRWRAEIGGPAYSSPALVLNGAADDGTAGVLLVVTERGGLLHALNAADGAALWAVETGGQGDWRSASPVVVDGRIYVGSDRDGIIVFGEGAE